MNFQKEKEEDFDVPPFAEDFFRLLFFDKLPRCEPASRCMLDVFDFFATAMKGYWLLVIGYRL